MRCTEKPACTFSLNCICECSLQSEMALSYLQSNCMKAHSITHQHCYPLFVWLPFRPYYGLPDNFPSDQLLTRSVTGKKRNLYLASRLVKEILRRNELHVKVCTLYVHTVHVHVGGESWCSTKRFLSPHSQLSRLGMWTIYSCVTFLHFSFVSHLSLLFQVFLRHWGSIFSFLCHWGDVFFWGGGIFNLLSHRG